MTLFIEILTWFSRIVFGGIFLANVISQIVHKKKDKLETLAIATTFFMYIIGFATTFFYAVGLIP